MPTSCLASSRRRTMTWPMRPSPMNPTFMKLSPSAELAAHPVELAADVIDDIAGLEVVGQHVPGIGLDFELSRQRLDLVETQRVLDGETRGAERPEIVEEDRNVEVGAPFARSRVLLPGGERILQIEEARQLAVLLFDGLSEIDGVGVALQRVHDRLG